MADFYIPPSDPSLDLTINSELVVSGLGSDKSGITSSNAIIDKPIGISSVAISRFQIPAKKLDEDLISGIGAVMNQINDKKQEIVDLSNFALAGYIPGINPPICELASSAGNLNSPITSETGKLNSSAPLIGSGSGLPGLETPDIAFGVVRKDAVRVWRAPYLEQRIAPNDFAFENLKYPILTPDIAGQGKENIIFENSKYEESGITVYCWDDEGNWSSQGWQETGDTLGKFYKITGPGLGTARFAGVYDNVTQVFTLDEEYQGMLGILTGITTGNYSAGGIGTGIYSEYNPTTGQLTPFFTFFPIPDGPGYFTFSSVGICNSLISQIETLENEVENLRVGLSTFLEPPNILKGKKHNEQTKMWSLKRVEVKNTEEVTNIGIATDTIVTIDPTLPTQLNSFDDEIISTFDSSLIRFDSY
jgi:hypothetical protein